MTNTAAISLINMPLAATQQPSLGLSLLKAGLNESGIKADIHYLNIWYAEIVGLKLLDRIDAFPKAQLVGESLFAEALWGPGKVDHDGYFEDVLLDKSLEHKNYVDRLSAQGIKDDLHEARLCVEGFLNRCVEEIDWGKYKLVGFTSMFQQHLASLALAKRLKERWPGLHISFGGSNCEAMMGFALLRHFPFVDSVCTGMGDHTFAQFCEDFLKGKPLAAYPNMYHRHKDIDFLMPNTSVANMDTIPLPDFSDFFVQRVEKSELPPEKMYLMLETSRGCWWGQKHHCTFCGLNADTLKYSHKSADRALHEFSEMIARWGHYTNRITVVDNIIPVDYLRTLLPRLKETGLGAGIFYETKANLTKEQIELYRDAGLRYVQPGIESLSTDVLRDMKKGVTALQNIQTLKWCREYNVTAVWNYLIGIPGEKRENYVDQPKVINALQHLTQPTMNWVRLDRFSPYQTNPAAFGVSNIRPYSAYRYLYPEIAEEDLPDLAYFFLGDFEAQDAAQDYAEPIEAAIDSWQRNSCQNALFHFEAADELVICDFRSIAKKPITVLGGPQRFIYELCDGIQSFDKIKSKLSVFLNRDVTPDEIHAWLAPLLDQDLILEDYDNYLALSVSTDNGYFPPETLWPRMEALLTDHPRLFGEEAQASFDTV